MEIEKRVRELVEEKIADRDDLFLVEAKMHSNGQLIILIDGDEGVTIEDCVKISRHVGFHLEEENVLDQAYNLEVSSPGIDMPLIAKRQFPKNIGRSVQISLEGEKGETIVKEGELISVDDENVTINEVIKNKNLPKGRKPKTEMVVIPFEQIRTTKVLISFK